ncbi:general secretion pathway protein GspD [Vibrio lentus]|uniref:General secretion pathway protein GspD n=2 Tax=Vibrio lentus TaxID=136468 RepID=A0A855ISI5_9VIBR|nr:pilus assembly protein N-terminal domain-containing protein [Vibrio lentus]MCB5362007.1 general secretion pathway protein GspD [Vibrio lentus]MCB5452342.1 general secretion pathway protein GspD [Vibrio lentus]MCB5464375.1 general secretion pathway protein GspD [Vibrio lentus]MCB5464511.1 general secretion pathway protein GspD [Vibrio lentus]MCC4794863.1 pilus assembly protein N-terminal domain-containing protein [Vibrio lentus]
MSSMFLRKYIVGLILLIGLFTSTVWASGFISMAEGDARSFTISQEIGSVFVSNPSVANYQVIDKHKVVIFSKEAGKSSLMVFDQTGKTILSRRIQVNKSADTIQRYIRAHYPDAQVEAFYIGSQVVLSGMVSSEQVKDEIYVIVGEMLDKDADRQSFEMESQEQSYEIKFMERKEYNGVVNNIEVVTTKQVNVKVSIAEVSQSALEQIGVSYFTGGQSPNVFVNPINGFSADDILTMISAINNDNVGRVLAEPNLSVVSGESASFLVGGELPIVTTIDGGSNVTYKEFGVRLELMAKVKRDNKIILSLIPEVSSLDTQYKDNTYDLPALKTRRARTTVELGDGQSFVLGGLLSTEDKESLSKIPLIGDIPIIGTFFRNAETRRNKTELIIVATVNLVQPVHPSTISLPTIKRTSTLKRLFSWQEENSQSSATESLLDKGGFKK